MKKECNKISWARAKSDIFVTIQLAQEIFLGTSSSIKKAPNRVLVVR
jgi:hypothetical protein